MYKDYRCLPPEVEACSPDYTLYPNWEPAVGFLTRGCARHCEWCVVPQKEGPIRPAAAWTDIKRPDSRRIIFLDKAISLAAAQFDAIGSENYETVRIQYILAKAEQNGGLDTALLRQITSAILIHPTGAVSLKLKNGQTIERSNFS